MRFKDLHIIDPILKAIEDRNYQNPTAIQEKAIPHLLQRKDIIACAQTGTGKTAAFAIPIIQLIQKIEFSKPNQRANLRSLIITPTRELAIQIDDNIKAYSKYTKVKHTVIYGGVKQGTQVSKLKSGVHILVATPGRLLDLIQQGYISLDLIKIMVLDEADRMLDMGFIHDVKRILNLIPSDRQTLLFSATMPAKIVELSKNILRNPVRVDANPVSSSPKLIKQYIYYTNRNTKKDLLLHILKDSEIDHLLLFTRTKRGADRIGKFLTKNNVPSLTIHGDKGQNQRQKALKLFKERKIRVLVATDIAARGIDINHLELVINLDIPEVAETYVHRIGRSGRAGKPGSAISICEPEENAFIRDIEKLIQKKLTVLTQNPFPQTDKPMTAVEKKQWNKEKSAKKQAFFTNRRKKLTSKSPRKQYSR